MGPRHEVPWRSYGSAGARMTNPYAYACARDPNGPAAWSLCVCGSEGGHTRRKELIEGGDVITDGRREDSRRYADRHCSQPLPIRSSQRGGRCC